MVPGHTLDDGSGLMSHAGLIALQVTVLCMRTDGNALEQV